MLKYMISLCIVSLCNADPSITGTYDKLVLVQRFPITKFFFEEAYKENQTNHSVEFLQYLKNNIEMFEVERWVIHGLWPLDSNNNVLTKCTAPSSRILDINYDHLHEDLKTNLKSEWPILSITETDKSKIEQEYSDYGTCVTEDPPSYFQKALQLMQTYNMNRIFGDMNVYPNNEELALYFIRLIIKRFTDKYAIFECLRPEHLDRQYLLDVQICFNSAEDVIDCPNSLQRTYDKCNSWQDIEYPRIPAFYYDLLQSSKYN